MPRAAHKLRIIELEDGRYSITPIVQSYARRSREFANTDDAMRHVWALISTSDDQYYLEYEPRNVIEPTP